VENSRISKNPKSEKTQNLQGPEPPTPTLAPRNQEPGYRAPNQPTSITFQQKSEKDSRHRIVALGLPTISPLSTGPRRYPRSDTCWTGDIASGLLVENIDNCDRYPPGLLLRPPLLRQRRSRPASCPAPASSFPSA
jgi:hypothetical protein